MNIKKIPYDPIAFSRLVISLDGYEEFFEAEIIAGRATMWEVDQGESYAITRVELDEKRHGNLMVLCCYEGQKIKEFTEKMIEVCRGLGFVALRAHATRPGMWKIGESLGFQELERVYIYEL